MLCVGLGVAGGGRRGVKCGHVRRHGGGLQPRAPRARRRAHPHARRRVRAGRAAAAASGRRTRSLAHGNCLQQSNSCNNSL